MRTTTTQCNVRLRILIGSLLLLATWIGPAAAGDHAHDQARCGGCHVGAVANAQRCLSCHQPSVATDLGRVFHVRSSTDCLACHVFHQPSRLKAGDRTFTVSLDDPATREHCRSCHAPGVRLEAIDPAHREAAALVYHDDRIDLAQLSPSEGCLLCHEDGGGASAVATTQRPPRFRAHASHPFGIRVFPGQGRGDGKIRDQLDHRLSLPRGMIECQTCHSLPAATVDLLVPFATPEALCLGCHQLGDTPPTLPPSPLALADTR